MGASGGIYDGSHLLSNPSFALFDPLQHMLLPYVDSILAQPQTSQDWNPPNFPNQDGFSMMQ